MNMKLHEGKCNVCNSPSRKEIERDYINGFSLREIETEYPGISAMSMCRHVQAFPELREKRSPEAILDRIIEHGAIGKMRIDPRVLLLAVQTKLKMAGKLSDSGRQDINVNVVVQQEGKEQLEQNRRLAIDRLRYSPSDDN